MTSIELKTPEKSPVFKLIPQGKDIDKDELSRMLFDTPEARKKIILKEFEKLTRMNDCKYHKIKIILANKLYKCDHSQKTFTTLKWIF